MAGDGSVIYLVASHTKPRQVLRLVRALRRGSPGCRVVVHHNASVSHLDRGEAESAGASLVEPHVAVEWGRFSQLQMILGCLDWVIERHDFQWLVMLSGQDYPIRPLHEFEARLGEDLDALVETAPCPRPRQGEPWDEFAARYHCHWRRVPDFVPHGLARRIAGRTPGLRWRALPRSGDWVGLPARRTVFGAGLACFRGADWLTLSHRAVEAIRRFGTAHPEVLEHYRRTLIPSESYPQTALANSPGLRLSAETRRFGVWDESHATGPRTLRLEDLPLLEACGCDFARKFDQDLDAEILEAIDDLMKRERGVGGGA